MSSMGALAGAVGRAATGAVRLRFKSPPAMNFFDRTIFKRNWRKINAGPLKKAGLMVRKFAIQSIRKRKLKSKSGKTGKPSPIGTAPRSRSPGDPLRRIFSVTSGGFNLEEIVGVLGLGGSNPVPGLHELGGTAVRRVIIKRGRRRSRKTGRFQKGGTRRVSKTVRYPKRPIIRPALQAVKKKFPELWKRSITGASITSRAA